MSVMTTIAVCPEPVPAMSRPATAASLLFRLHTRDTTAPARRAGQTPDTSLGSLCRTNPILGTLEETELRTLMQAAKGREVKRRTSVWHEGDRAGMVVLVLSGHLKLWAPLVDGGEVVFEIARAGDCVGEMAALQDGRHDCDLTALSDVRLLLIEARAFRTAFASHPGGLAAIARIAAERMCKARQQVTDSRALSAPARLAKALLGLVNTGAGADGRGGPAGMVGLVTHVSQSDLGAMAGLCRELVNKYLRAWREAGWIHVLSGRVVHLNARAMAELRDGDEGHGRLRR